MEKHKTLDVPSGKAVTAESSTSSSSSSSSKLKRAFSMPRNPFQGSRNSTTKVNSAASSSSSSGGGAPACNGRLGGGYSNNSGSAVSADTSGGSDGNDSNNSKNVTEGDDSRNESRLWATATATAAATATNGNCNDRHSNNKSKKSALPEAEMTSPAEDGGGSVEGGKGNEKKIFRRLSVKKFINRIAQQMTYVNRTMGNHKFDRVQSSQQSSTLHRSVARARGNEREGGTGENFVWPPDTIPGVIGLRNHGNTCFMNAVLQCLSHTDILAQYFVLDLYKADLKRRNKINAKKFGTKGELTEQLALVLKSLWTCKDAPDYSSNFKAVVDRYGSQFRSSTQHDAQEFLFWLLDKVHEDLNTATKRKYKTIKNNGRSDEVIAAETLANYVRCNNSFVQAVFQAQFRSSLSCPTCGKQSNTFDPFYCLSVPLPQLSQQPVLVKVIYCSQQPKQVKLGLGIPHGSPVLALREQLHADTGIALDRMVLTEICESGFSRVFCDSHLMSSVRELDPLYCIESPADASAAQQQRQDAASGSKMLLLLCNGKRIATTATPPPPGCSDVKRFGTPFCMMVNRDISYTELQKLLLKEMSGMLRSEVFTFATPAQNLFRMRLQDPSCDADTYLEASVEHPLFTEMIDLALSVLPCDAGPAHVKLLLEWSEPERFFHDMGDPFVEHESVCQMKEKIPASSALTLEQCFEHYTKAETLGQDNAWKCPHCQEYLPVVKTLGLWSLPDIMVIHLKRFRQQQLRATTQAAKLTNLVKFPLRGFDMTPHLARDLPHQNNGGGHTHAAHNQPQVQGRGFADSDHWSPWRKIKRSAHSTQSHSNGAAGANGRRLMAMDNRYDLYAVCYHQGDTLETGHYTAACKNPYDGQWYRFDDQRVTHVPSERIDEEIINNEAYLLFYQRRKLPVAAGDGAVGECSGSSSCSSSGDHWVSKIIVPPPAVSSVTVPPLATPERSKTLPHSTSSSSSSATVVTAAASIPPNTDSKSPAVTTMDVESGPGSISAPGPKPATGTISTVSSSLDKTTDLSSDDTRGRSLDAESKPLADPKEQHDDQSSSEDCTVRDVQPLVDGSANGRSPKAASALPRSPSSLSLSSSLPAGSAEVSVVHKTTEAKDIVNSQEVVPKSQSPPPLHPATPAATSSPPSVEPPSQIKQTSTVATSAAAAAAATKAEDDDVATKVKFSLRLEKLQDRMVEHKLGGSNSSVAHGGGRFSLPSSQQYQDILWRENMSELIHHRPSSFATYKSVIDGDAVSLIRGANTCSKDTLLFIDQQGHGLDRVVLDDDDDPDELLPGSGSRALWISPVTPHKFITVSPKN